MNFQTWQQFIAMGGFGFYVWCSYAIVATVLIYNLILPMIHSKRLQKKLKNQPSDDCITMPQVTHVLEQ